MKVCLIRPPTIVPVGVFVGSLTPPIGLAYLTGSLKNAGHETVVIDSVGLALEEKQNFGDGLLRYGLNFEDICKLIPKDVGLIGISGMFSSDWNALKPLYQMICERSKNIFVLAGGEHFTAAPEVSMNYLPLLDGIALGEGEETIIEVANALELNKPLYQIQGLVLRKKNLKEPYPLSFFNSDNEDYIRTLPRKRIKQIDEISWPAWECIPVENYLTRELSYGVNRGRSMPMLASRGCPYSCTFCSNPQMWGTRWVARDVKDVVDEIEFYIKKYQITNIDFYDLTAIVKKKWIMNFCKELLKRKIDITWQLPSGTRSEAIDKDVCPLLYASGCRNMNYAPESGSKEILKLIKKKVKLKSLVNSLSAANHASINVKMNIIIGLPMESHIDIWKTLWTLVIYSFYGAYDVSIGIFAPYPGSELYDELVRKKRITHDDNYWDKLSYVDITKNPESYCEKVSSKWLVFYNWLGFALFYSSNYIFRPLRIFQTISHLKTGQHESRGEMALSQIYSRIKLYYST